MSIKTLGQLAELLNVQLQGDPRCEISGIAPLEKARTGDLSFLTNRQYRKFLQTTQASAVIIGKEEASTCTVNALVADNPRLILAKAAMLFEKIKMPSIGIHSTAVIGKDCQIAKTVSIAAQVVIGDRVILGENVVIGAGSVIGDDCIIDKGTVLKARVTLYDDTRMGQYCLVHSGAVIGSDGFGYANHEGAWVKMPHLGAVSIGDRVEIGANTTIDRGFLEDTVLKSGAIIDNLVQIGHNVSIGERTAIAACVGIAGSATIGAACLIGGGANIAGHLEIADNIHITATSGVNHSLSTPGVYSSGLPAKPNALWRKNVARFQYLDEMARRIRRLEKAANVTPSVTEDA